MLRTWCKWKRPDRKELSRAGRSAETEGRLVVAGGWGLGAGVGEWPTNGDGVSFCGHEDALALGSGEG